MNPVCLKIMLPTNYLLTKPTYMYKQDLALNNPKGLIYYKTTNQHFTNWLLCQGITALSVFLNCSYSFSNRIKKHGL